MNPNSDQVTFSILGGKLFLQVVAFLSVGYYNRSGGSTVDRIELSNTNSGCRTFSFYQKKDKEKN